MIGSDENGLVGYGRCGLRGGEIKGWLKVLGG